MRFTIKIPITSNFTKIIKLINGFTRSNEVRPNLSNLLSYINHV